MKRTLVLTLSLCAALLLCGLLLAACGSPADPVPTEAGATDTASPAGTDAPAPATEPDTETPTEAETEPETEEDTTPVAPFYACLYTGDLENGVSGQYDTLDEAEKAVNQKAYLGLRVCDSNGRLVYAPYTELQCDLLREAKWVTDYVRENRFKYGDAPINPAINNDAKKVSCDRLVCWVYYRVGFTDQPQSQGLVVSNFFPWCEKHGFEKITRPRDLQPGDLVGVRPSSNGKYPEHVFMYAGETRYGRAYKGTGDCRRYDCGSDTRIQSVQPFTEPINDFMCAYRPVVRTAVMTKLSNNVTETMNLSYACELYVAIRDAEWGNTDKEPTFNYSAVVEGHEYMYDSTHNIIQDTETGKTAELSNDWRSTFRGISRNLFKTPSAE